MATPKVTGSPHIPPKRKGHNAEARGVATKQKSKATPEAPKKSAGKVMHKASTKNSAKNVTDMERDWQAQSDMHTLLEAHSIQNDPARHKAARSHAKKKYAALKSAGMC